MAWLYPFVWIVCPVLCWHNDAEVLEKLSSSGTCFEKENLLMRMFLIRFCWTFWLASKHWPSLRINYQLWVLKEFNIKVMKSERRFLKIEALHGNMVVLHKTWESCHGMSQKIFQLWKEVDEESDTFTITHNYCPFPYVFTLLWQIHSWSWILHFSFFTRRTVLVQPIKAWKC